MHEQRYVDGRAGIDAQLVARLIDTQFPQCKHLPMLPVEHDGWDNRSYRFGADMSVRLPTAAGYVTAVDKERRGLPVLARSLPVPVPVPLAAGQPGEGYPFPWSGLTEVAGFIGALHRINPTGGPGAGAHSFFRGAALTHYDTESRRALGALTNQIDTAAVEALWNDALAASWHGSRVWFHGDVAAGNLIVVDGRLSLL